jgi:tetratricopeptide (TPR) repeat protein
MPAKVDLFPQLLRTAVAVTLAISLLTTARCFAENLTTRQVLVSASSSDKNRAVGSRVLNFPDHPVADLEMYKGSQLMTIKPATGKVSVPSGVTTLLRFSYEICGKLGDDLNRLSPTNVDEIVLATSNVSDEDLSAVGRLYGLKALVFSHTGIKDPGLKNLGALKELRTLCLNDTLVSDYGFRYLKGLRSLEELDLTCTGVTSKVLPMLVPLTSLKKLDIAQTKITDVHLEELACLPKLESLDMRKDNITDEGMKKLSRLKHLRVLALEETRVTSAGIKYLRGMKSLRELRLNNTAVDDNAIPALVSLPLKTLALPGTKISNNGQRFLQLRLPNCEIDDDLVRTMAHVRENEVSKNPKDLIDAEAALESDLDEGWNWLTLKQRIDLLWRLSAVKTKLHKVDQLMDCLAKIISEEIKGGLPYRSSLTDTLQNFEGRCVQNPALTGKAIQLLESVVSRTPEGKVPPQVFSELVTLANRLPNAALCQRYRLRTLAALKADQHNIDVMGHWVAWERLGDQAAFQQNKGLAAKYYNQAWLAGPGLSLGAKLCSASGIVVLELEQNRVSKSKGTLEALVKEILQRKEFTIQFLPACVFLIRCDLMEHNPGKAREILAMMDSAEEKQIAPVTDLETRIDMRLAYLEQLRQARDACQKYGYSALAEQVSSSMKKVAGNSDLSETANAPWTLAWKKLAAMMASEVNERIEAKLRSTIGGSEKAGKPQTVEEADLVVGILSQIPPQMLGFTAEPILEKCVRIYDANCGPDSPQSIPALKLLEQIARNGNEQTVWRYASRLRKAKLANGAGDADDLRLLMQRVQKLQDQQRYTESLATAREAQTLCQKLEGKGSLNDALVTEQIAANHKQQGKYADAEKEYLKAIAGLESFKAARTEDLVWALNCLGNLYDETKQPAKGVAVRKRAADAIAASGNADLARRVLGPTLTMIALEFMRMQQKDEALAIYRRAKNLPSRYASYPRELEIVREYLRQP